jgi:hypothetical protein
MTVYIGYKPSSARIVFKFRPVKALLAAVIIVITELNFVR